ncbi:MAG TPA: hypothetical protein VFP84_34430 [Kofleriaceae bacterium]|nr:hypothetical protein [Kofleriaceae bacterium]
MSHPKGYAVVQTVATVYFGDNIRCDEIKYGDRTEAELAAITSDEVDVSGGGRIVLDRLGAKAVVVRGYDIQHRLVTAGCQDVGELSGATSVAITTQATAVVAIDPDQPDRPFAGRPILVTMTDANGAPLDGVVSWQLTGPAGAPDQPPAAGQMTTNGETTIHVADLGTPGPEGLRLRVPWATEPLPLVTAFDVSHATTLALAGANATGIHPSCDVRGHAGKPPTLVCLTAATGVTNHRDAVEIAWQTDHYAITAFPALGHDNAFAIVVDHDGSASEPVYVISQDVTGKAGHWTQIDPAGADRALTFDNDLASVVYVAKCPGSASALVGVTTSPPLAPGVLFLESYMFYTPGGAAVMPSAPQGEALSGGCVAGIDGQTRQAVVIASQQTGNVPTLFVLGADRAQAAVAGGRLDGSGFVTVTAGGATEQRLAGTRLQASGTVVFEAVLAPSGDAASPFSLVERTEVDAAAPPIKILGGLLDHDADSDLIWDIGTGARKRDFQVSLARQVGGAPLTAITSGPAVDAGVTADFTVGDFDGNGVAEVALFTPGSVTIYQP